MPSSPHRPAGRAEQQRDQADDEHDHADHPVASIADRAAQLEDPEPVPTGGRSLCARVLGMRTFVESSGNGAGSEETS